jgi:hypothetical protein
LVGAEVSFHLEHEYIDVFLVSLQQVDGVGGFTDDNLNFLGREELDVPVIDYVVVPELERYVENTCECG